MEPTVVREGKVVLRLPHAVDLAQRGPGTRPRRGDEGEPDGAPTPQVFYNPAMALNRDLSSVLVATRAKEGWHVLDGLAASGVRGLRYALEAGVPVQLESNDWNPVAARLVRENAEANGVDAHVTTRNLAPLLHESVWDVVDVDPYGSPAPFLDGATRAVRNGGLLGLTATDTTALAGVYPKVCARRYFATPLHGELGHEAALRILAGAAVRHAARHDLAVTPVLAHATDHYYRVTFQCRRGASRADEALEGVGVLFLCAACGARGFADAEACPDCGASLQRAGPLWTGPLTDAATAEAMLARAEAHPIAAPASRPLLALLAEESRGPQTMFDLHEAGARLHVSSPPTSAVVDALVAAGHPVGPVHFNRLAIRTSAPASEVHRAVRDASAAAGRA